MIQSISEPWVNNRSDQMCVCFLVEYCSEHTHFTAKVLRTFLLSGKSFLIEQDADNNFFSLGDDALKNN